METIEANNISIEFQVKQPGAVFNRGDVFKAVDDVSISIKKGTTLGIVGESGSGKSTFVRGLLGLLPLAEGKILVDRKQASALNAQLVFQDPFASLDPRFTIFQSISEPAILSGLSQSEVKQRVTEIMRKVGLDESLAHRYPHEFSGGQCQRVGIARALIAQPEILICDEPVSALDVSIRAQILNLLKQIQSDYNLTMIFIAHDIGVVKLMSHEVMVMYQGQVVEQGKVETVYSSPGHPYTKKLIESQLKPDPVQARAQLSSTTVSSDNGITDSKSACAYLGQCDKATEQCSSGRPELTGSQNGTWLRCFNPLNQ